MIRERGDCCRMTVAAIASPARSDIGVSSHGPEGRLLTRAPASLFVFVVVSTLHPRDVLKVRTSATEHVVQEARRVGVSSGACLTRI